MSILQKELNLKLEEHDNIIEELDEINREEYNR